LIDGFKGDSGEENCMKELTTLKLTLPLRERPSYSKDSDVAS